MKTEIQNNSEGGAKVLLGTGAKSPIRELKSYECSIDGEHWSTFNALSRGMAKSEYLRDLDIDGVAYTAVRCRVKGYPFTSDGFRNMAAYRKIEFAYCGMVVKVGDWNGVIVGYNSSANLNVLVTDGKYRGQVLNCHPHSEVTYYDKSGNVVRAFCAGT